MATTDTSVLRELASVYMDVATLDHQAETAALWARHNSLQPGRPLVLIDQLPWNELAAADELALRCEDPFHRSLEWYMRTRLYQWRHFPVDMVVDPVIAIPKIVAGNTIGPTIEEDVAVADSTNEIVSHRYHDRLSEPADLESITDTTVIVDPAGDRRHLEEAQAILGDIVPVRLSGVSMHCGVWDRIVQLRGAEPVLLDCIDRPEFQLDMMHRFVAAYLDLLDQLEALDLLDPYLPLIHCTGAYTDELPAVGYVPGHARPRDVWAFGMAQILGAVSPAMYDEFEVEPIKPLLDRFGLVYYGCCDPIDRKIPLLRKLPTVRKISVSPWADKALCADLMAGDYVYSAKPNPAFLAGDHLDEDLVRRDLAETVRLCQAHDTVCELILKDVSTVSYHPQNLATWANIAMAVVGA